MKKVKYLGLIMLVVLLLTGCGSTDSAKNSENTNKPTAVDPPSKTGYTGVLKIVYLDPTNLNKKCTEENADSEDETKGGCMKWYAYAEDDDTYTMILDHNTTDLVNWVTKSDYLEAGGSEENITTYTDGRNTPSTDKGPVTALKQLKEDTTNWDNSLNARLIKVSEVQEIVGCETTTCRFESSSENSPSSSSKTSKYAWLNATTNEYWTDTSAGDSTAYFISSYNLGGIGAYSVCSDCWYGIRPVITVQKSNLLFVEESEE